jgi:predicted nucleic-acid-binding Zn-ribbon protein
MIIRNISGRVKCPKCESENIETKWSSTTVVSWLDRILGVPMIKIFEKKCMQCGKEFQVFRK